MLYFDTSAFASLFTDDVHSDRVRAHIAQAVPRAIVSDLTLIEFSAVAGKLVRRRSMSDAAALGLLQHAEDWVRRLATRFEMSPADVRVADSHVRRFDLALRAPDAIHIAICQRLGLTLATCDGGQANAAQALGLAVADLSATAA